MLRKIGAALVAVGLFLPYSPDVRVIASVWHNAAEVLFQGFPVLLAFVYVLHTFAPPLARFHERHGQALHGSLRMVYFVLVGAYLATATAGRADWPALGPVLAALVVTGGLLYWGQGRGQEGAIPVAAADRWRGADDRLLHRDTACGRAGLRRLGVHGGLRAGARGRGPGAASRAQDRTRRLITSAPPRSGTQRTVRGRLRAARAARCDSGHFSWGGGTAG